MRALIDCRIRRQHSGLRHRRASQAAADPATGKPVDRCRERVTHLLETLQQENAKIVIPTPALAEVLVRAAKGGPEFLRILSSSKHFRIAPFDERAAVEFAARQAERRPASGLLRRRARRRNSTTRSSRLPRSKARRRSIPMTKTSPSLQKDASTSSKSAPSRCHPSPLKAHCHSRSMINVVSSCNLRDGEACMSPELQRGLPASARIWPAATQLR